VLKIWRQAVDSTGEPELLVDALAFNPSVTPDGTWLIYSVYDTSEENSDIMQMALDGSKRVSPLVSTPFSEGGAEVSPDGALMGVQVKATGQTWVATVP
jgi:hypothetical protein